MILTDTEISECLTGGPKTVARMIEAAVLAKFCAGVEMPEPIELNPASNSVLGYTADRLHAYGAAVRLKALEEAAVVCDAEPEEQTGECGAWETSTYACANAIRTLKGTP